jgi:hypothetical protein
METDVLAIPYDESYEPPNLERINKIVKAQNMFENLRRGRDEFTHFAIQVLEIADVKNTNGLLSAITRAYSLQALIEVCKRVGEKDDVKELLQLGSFVPPYTLTFRNLNLLDGLRPVHKYRLESGGTSGAVGSASVPASSLHSSLTTLFRMQAFCSAKVRSRADFLNRCSRLLEKPLSRPISRNYASMH